MRMNAYYYSFEPTGELPIDRILSAVASAGKAYHLTEDWGCECDGEGYGQTGSTPVAWIQQAANAAASGAKRDAATLARIRRIVDDGGAHGSMVMDDATLAELVEFAIRQPDGPCPECKGVCEVWGTV